MSLTILGSGSAGNCSLVSLHGDDGQAVHVLIDVGLSPRETNRRLGDFGLGVADISNILATHFDRDHFNPGWNAHLHKISIPVHVHRRHRNPASRALSGRFIAFYDNNVSLEGATHTTVETTLFAHDAQGTVGFIIEHGGARLGYATDLGVVPQSLFEFFVGLDALALESNYDRQMQTASDRPAFLKRRIMGGAGHLSNDQALKAVVRIAQCSDLQHIALLHLSRQCNCPQLLESLYAKQAGHLLDRLTITNQKIPTRKLHIMPRENGSIIVEPLPQPGEQHVMF